MATDFADVLAFERSCLSKVNTRVQFAVWRNRVVGELMNPQSPYSHVVRLTVATPERAHFLERWQALLAETVERLLISSAKLESPFLTGDVAISGSENTGARGVDPDKTAVLILAALHGGTTLSRADNDPRCFINPALDMAFARLNGDHNDTGSEVP